MGSAQEAIGYIENHNWRHSRLGLGRIAQLLQKVGNPQNRLQFVHVAGTNGKSSTCCMLASVLQAAGNKTGLYTSPYVSRFNERMQIDGVPISDKELMEVTGIVRAAAETMEDHPTEFELVTAVGLLWFARSGCTLVVLEVGLGGRLDATNIIPAPLLCLITTIDLDHTDVLGNSLAAIAAEKAGIIKPGTHVLCYPQSAEAMQVIEEVCAAQGVPLTVLDTAAVRARGASLKADRRGQRFEYGALKELRLQLLGPYQIYNAALVIRAAQLLCEMGVAVSAEAVRQGLQRARWPARFELVQSGPHLPYVFVDGGHNPQGAVALGNALQTYFPGRKVLFVMGVMADKDYRLMIRLLKNKIEKVFCVTPDNPRALPAKDLAAAVRKAGAAAESCDSIEAGVRAAVAAAGPEGVVCAFGSLYMAGQVRAVFEGA